MVVETPQVLKYRHKICYFLVAQQYCFLLLQSLLSEQKPSATKSSNIWVLPSPEFVVLSVSKVFVSSLSLSKPYSSLLHPVPARAQSTNHHPMGRTGCVTPFTKGFAQLGSWVVPSYFPDLSKRHTVLKYLSSPRRFSLSALPPMSPFQSAQQMCPALPHGSALTLQALTWCPMEPFSNTNGLLLPI